VNCEKQICTICRLLVEVRANAADSQADLMLLAIPPQSPAISIQPFTTLSSIQSLFQEQKFSGCSKATWFSPNSANTPSPLPDPGPEAALKWSQLRPAISIQAGEPAAGGSRRDSSAPSLFIIRKACLLSGFGLLQCRRSRLRLSLREPLGRSEALLVFSILRSFLSSGSRPAQEGQKMPPAQGRKPPGSGLAPAVLTQDNPPCAS